MTVTLRVLDAGALTTVQDSGRPGLAAMGVGRSGACDRASYQLANRLLRNDPGTATLEVTFGGLALQPSADVMLALTGARCPGVPHNAPFTLAAGRTLRLAPPVTGLRTYLAVRGGVDVEPVLGSRSTDILAGLGPPVLGADDELPVGSAPRLFPNVDVAPVAEPAGDDVTVRVSPGPRVDWFTDDSWPALLTTAYEVTTDSNRVGIRLDGATLQRARTDELPSEGMLRGALQVPPSGLPVLFLADHPLTGGYPVIGYVEDDDVDRCAQLRPGQRLRLRATRGTR